MSECFSSPFYDTSNRESQRGVWLMKLHQTITLRNSHTPPRGSALHLSSLLQRLHSYRTQQVQTAGLLL